MLQENDPACLRNKRTSKGKCVVEFPLRAEKIVDLGVLMHISPCVAGSDIFSKSTQGK